MVALAPNGNGATSIRWDQRSYGTVALLTEDKELTEQEIDSPRPWWEPYGGPLATVVAAINKKLDAKPDLMRHRTAGGAAEMVRSEWKYIRGIAFGDAVGRRGGGSAAFEMSWRAGALPNSNTPERFRGNQ